MLLTPHTIVGIAIASTVPDIKAAVPLSFFLHFMGDIVPHWDFYTQTTKDEKLNGWRPLAVMADLALGVAVGVFFTLHALWVIKDVQLAISIFMCGVASVLPDVITAPALYLGHENTGLIPRVIHNIQRVMQFPTRLPWGLFTQIFIVLFCLLLILGSGA